jgi:hypothetical protein
MSRRISRLDLTTKQQKGKIIMETPQQKLEAIYNLLNGKDDTKQALAYGITKDKDSNILISKILAKGDDIYEMIDELHEDEGYLVNDFVTLRTTGWAAPLNNKGEMEGAPSVHPDRRRVSLLVSVDIVNKEVIGSSLKFDDDVEVIYDFNQATGSLAMAMESLIS